ncbi:hypothetical protein TraAM80_03047 [Trypanosoma rangeli]|uniref:PDZ domain-containing protein n=1 Tax=Trypanosoma rangeli TaxID=5698 RepID=A0A3R7L5S6_TRYRA|nr:uncharacterized protein TraAM80_03047 [Trypanosoma rangeli]RNF08191.1 hypothetical protein TraAM80_03047 [Trypanosoma rangeli]|eukprot:RNF08191.1 hypothetical protein TraAM80_03047 [Trypanosoma rangeli]
MQMTEATLGAVKPESGPLQARSAAQPPDRAELQQMVAREVAPAVCEAVAEAVRRQQREQAAAAQRQNEEMMDVLREVERRVTVLQRRVDTISHEHRKAYKLLGRLCCAIEGATPEPPSHGEMEPVRVGGLFNALLQELEAGRLDAVRLLLVAGLAPFLHEAQGELRHRQRTQSQKEETEAEEATRGITGSEMRVITHTVSSSSGAPGAPQRLTQRPSTILAPPSLCDAVVSSAKLKQWRTLHPSLDTATALESSKRGAAGIEEVVLQRRSDNGGALDGVHPYASAPANPWPQGMMGNANNNSAVHSLWGATPRQTVDYTGGSSGRSVSLSCRRSPRLDIEAVDAACDLLPAHLAKKVAGGGVRVLATARDGIAARSGVLAGDIIFALGNRSVPTCGRLAQALEDACAAGYDATGLKLHVYRHSVREELALSLV